MSQPASPSSPTAPADDAAGGRRGGRGSRGSLVGSMIAIAAMLFVVTGAILFWRSATMNEPECILLVEGSPALKGADVVVEGLPLDKPLKMQFGAAGRYVIPFYLNPGTYTVEVTRDGLIQYRAEVALSRRDPGRRLSVPDAGAGGATTLPARSPF